MRLTDHRRVQLTGGLIAVLVILTRWPFRSFTLFEFDSVDFAVATFRFSLVQVTPHMPGYILHVLLGRLFNLATHDINQAFVVISILLSVGSAIFLWRAAYHLRGERVALIVAAIWITHPFFWFYGEVATVYIYESFFASALLMLGLGMLRDPDSKWRAIAIGIVLSLATGSRQSSLLFFAPAIVYLFVTTKQSRANWIKCAASFAIVTAIWTFELLRESGGIATYLHFAGLEHIYRTQSMLFGNPIREHLAIIVKIFMYLIAGSLLLLVAGSIALAFFYHRSIAFVREATRSRSFKFAMLLAIVPLLFYVTIYFMKAGYLLNVWPSIILASGVLVDHCAIMLARRRKEKSSDHLLLSRPLLTRSAVALTLLIVVIQVIWFIGRLPGKDWKLFTNANTQDSFSQSLTKRYESANSGELALNRLFAFSSRQAVQATDVDNVLLTQKAFDLIDSAKGPITLLATWWSRQAYFYLSKEHVYDIRTDAEHKLLVGESHDHIRKALSDSVIKLRREPTYLLIRQDHPDLPIIQKQVKLREIPMPHYLELYEVMDSTFSFTWDGVRFVKE